MSDDLAMGIVGSLVILMVPAYLVLQPLAAMRLRGGWRTASRAPLAVAVPTILCTH